jgi:AcrR family transcriptional regulator
MLDGSCQATYIAISKKGNSRGFEGTDAVVMGRPREFNVELALDRALEVFWRHGYEGASIVDLTTAMGINPPSLYAAFGNKAELFCKALNRYVERHSKHWDDALGAPTARAAVERLLRYSADFLTEKCNPRGCLIVRSSVSCNEAEDAVQKELTARRAQGEVRLRERFKHAQKDGEMPAALDPADYARYIMTVLEGMSVRAAAGATRKELHKIADMALLAWPA